MAVTTDDERRSYSVDIYATTTDGSIQFAKFDGLAVGFVTDDEGRLYIG